MKTYVIGDVHGCEAELADLVVLIMLDAKSEPIHLIFVGDLVDKGPDSLGCIDILEDLRSSDNITVTVVMGNHENKLLRWCNHEYRKSKFPSYVNPIERKPEWNIPLVKWAMGDTSLNPPITSSPIAKFPLFFQIPGTQHIVVHAGIPASLKRLPPSDYNESTRRDKQLMYCRYINGHGDMIQLGMEKETDPFWDDVYDGRFGHVFYGHQAYNEPKVTPYAIGLDTGCVYGGKLTAYCLDTKKFLSVNARKAYCEPYASEGMK